MCPIPTGFTILIADRNRRVRDFLKREMLKEGFGVYLAENAGELIYEALNRNPLDLIIVDPDFPGAQTTDLLRELQRRCPPVPVVVHTHYVNSWPEAAGCSGAGRCLVIEKGGSSVEKLKQVASQMLNLNRGDPEQGSGKP
jgi:DNA-binding NtrC family response regulator